MPDNGTLLIDIPFNGETRRLSAALTISETVGHQVVNTWNWSMGIVHFVEGKVGEIHDLVHGKTRCRASIPVEALLYLILEDWMRVKWLKPYHELRHLDYDK
jgi:hypothetical protein